MTNQYAINRFQNKELRLPSIYRPQIDNYVRSTQAGATVPYSPFRRTVDIWFLSMCIGAFYEERQALAQKDTWNFIHGSILASEPWRIDAIELLAISHHDSPYGSVDDEYPDPIELANQYANAGIKYVLDFLEDGYGEKLSNLGMSLLALVSRDS